ncbi:type II secretion system protein [Chitinibacteraceae bacterium HSL-7]
MTRRKGFTLIELLVVLAIMASLLTLVVPRYFQQTDRASETVLKHNLVSMRDAIDKFYADTGKYPETLDELVSRRYLREIPVDPVSGKRNDWRTISPDGGSGVFDIKSNAPGNDAHGTPYTDY